MTNYINLQKLRNIYVPPAYKNVEIFPDSKKLIAKGVDSKNRVQYLYHTDFIRDRQYNKNCRVANKMLKVLDLQKKLKILIFH